MKFRHKHFSKSTKINSAYFWVCQLRHSLWVKCRKFNEVPEAQLVTV